MTLASAVTDVLPTLRAEAEAAMPDTCTITRSGGEPVFDPNTGTYTPAAPSTVYTGRCRVQAKADEVVAAGDQPVTLRRFTASLPVATSGIEVDDVLTVTDSADADLVGLSLRVVDAKSGTWLVARRLTLEHNAG